MYPSQAKPNGPLHTAKNAKSYQLNIQRFRAWLYSPSEAGIQLKLAFSLAYNPYGPYLRSSLFFLSFSISFTQLERLLLAESQKKFLTVLNLRSHQHTARTGTVLYSLSMYCTSNIPALSFRPPSGRGPPSSLGKPRFDGRSMFLGGAGATVWNYAQCINYTPIW